MSDFSESVIAQAFVASLKEAGRHEHPYRHWLLERCLPEDVIDALIDLPVAPPPIGDTRGRRETHNDSRIHFGEANRLHYPVMDALSGVFQSPDVIDALSDVTGAALSGTSLRIEYCQDTDGFWLEPHTDIGVKKFTMLYYFSDHPDSADWGTDIYADRDTHVGRSPAAFNSAMVFVPGDNTWHGFEKRPITGVRKSLIINYVGAEWRNRHELCFPETPVQ